METRIEKVWRVRTKSGKFILGAQCGSDKDKREIMVNKKKSREEEIFIQNGLTWTERKNKDRIWDKAAEMKEKGKKAKVVGLRKMRTEEGTWAWSERNEKWFLDKESKLQDLQELEEGGT